MDNRCPDCGGGLRDYHCVECNAPFKMCIACWHKFPQQVCTHLEHGGKWEQDDDLAYLIPVKRNRYWTGYDVVKEIERWGCVFVRHVSQNLDDYKNPKTDRHCLVFTSHGDISDDTANNIFRVLGDPVPVYTKLPRYRCAFCDKSGISPYDVVRSKERLVCARCGYDVVKMDDD